MLSGNDVTTGYGQAVVLKNVSFKFQRGRFTALVGPNGCGKSTLLKAIMGFLPLFSGGIRLREQSLQKIKRRALAKQVAYLPQDIQCPEYMSLGELIELAGYSRYSLMGGPSEKDRQLFTQALETVGLADMANCHISKLSGGQRQRAWIAMVLAQDTDLILMDEPVNHLDIKYQNGVLTLVRDLCRLHGKTVVVVLHDLNLTAAYADDVVMMREGHIVASGNVEHTITEANVAQTFELPVEVFSREGRLVCLPRMAEVMQVPA